MAASAKGIAKGSKSKGLLGKSRCTLEGKSELGRLSTSILADLTTSVGGSVAQGLGIATKAEEGVNSLGKLLVVNTNTDDGNIARVETLRRGLRQHGSGRREVLGLEDGAVAKSATESTGVDGIVNSSALGDIGVVKVNELLKLGNLPREVLRSSGNLTKCAQEGVNVLAKEGGRENHVLAVGSGVQLTTKEIALTVDAESGLVLSAAKGGSRNQVRETRCIDGIITGTSLDNNTNSRDRGKSLDRGNGHSVLSLAELNLRSGQLNGRRGLADPREWLGLGVRSGVTAPDGPGGDLSQVLSNPEHFARCC
eukprot:Colp12_sorted_trinity150504_noHs@33977